MTTAATRALLVRECLPVPAHQVVLHPAICGPVAYGPQRPLDGGGIVLQPDEVSNGPNLLHLVIGALFEPLELSIVDPPQLGEDGPSCHPRPAEPTRHEVAGVVPHLWTRRVDVPPKVSHKLAGSVAGAAARVEIGRLDGRPYPLDSPQPRLGRVVLPRHLLDGLETDAGDQFSDPVLRRQADRLGVREHVGGRLGPLRDHQVVAAATTQAGFTPTGWCPSMRHAAQRLIRGREPALDANHQQPENSAHEAAPDRPMAQGGDALSGRGTAAVESDVALRPVHLEVSSSSPHVRGGKA